MPRNARSTRPARLRGAGPRPSSTRPAASRSGREVRPSAGPVWPAASARKAAEVGSGRATRLRRTPRSMRRMTVFGALVVFLAVLITPTLRSYLRAQGQIDGLRSQVTAQQADVRSLQAQQQRWSDPAYVKQQAATRLGFAAPGGTLTVLVDGKGTPRPVSKSGVITPDSSASTHPWYGRLWQSMVRTPPR